jgi:hypothetical protein
MSLFVIRELSRTMPTKKTTSPPRRRTATDEARQLLDGLAREMQWPVSLARHLAEGVSPEAQAELREMLKRARETRETRGPDPELSGEPG